MDPDVIRMEEYMDVVYSCKFCPVTCKLPTDMGAHVRENHLPLLLAAQGSPSIRNKEDPSKLFVLSYQKKLSLNRSSTLPLEILALFLF